MTYDNWKTTEPRWYHEDEDVITPDPNRSAIHDLKKAHALIYGAIKKCWWKDRYLTPLQAACYNIQTVVDCFEEDDVCDQLPNGY
jgi:hypothetical protein